jgi:hypothetical protein
MNFNVKDEIHLAISDHIQAFHTKKHKGKKCNRVYKEGIISFTNNGKQDIILYGITVDEFHGLYYVHFHLMKDKCEFNCYSAMEYKDEFQQREYCYQDKKGGILLDFDRKKALNIMNGTVEWKSAWINRLYSMNMKYSGDEFPFLSKLHYKIETYCKAKVSEQAWKDK